MPFWIKDREVSAVLAFPFLKEASGSKKHIISFVGGGGKTTLMYFMAQSCAKDKKVLVMTSTHIFMPKETVYASDMQSVRALWQEGNFAVIGEKSKEKLTLPQKELMEDAMREAQLVLIEADGSKRLPCKVPKEHEPVILKNSDIVVAVMGMSALDYPIEKVCFRLEEAKKLLQVEDGHLIDINDAAHILSSVQGAKKQVDNRDFFVVLNQCDDEKRKKQAGEIAKKLYDKKIGQVILSQFPEELRSEGKA